jgi:hypothetical protein
MVWMLCAMCHVRQHRLYGTLAFITIRLLVLSVLQQQIMAGSALQGLEPAGHVSAILEIPCGNSSERCNKQSVVC